MKVTEILYSELSNSDRWTTNYFLQNLEQLKSHYPLVNISEIVVERKTTVDPKAIEEEFSNYLGLDNIRTQTGELLDFFPRKTRSIKSRSKVFLKGDILYGKLRPELNKVYLCTGELNEGICSGEFLVLIPNLDKVNPIFLRHILASDYVKQAVQKYRNGASLPRISMKDLGEISIPLPSLDIQNELSKELEIIDLEIKTIRKRLDTLPLIQTNSLFKTMVKGDVKLQFNLT